MKYPRAAFLVLLAQLTVQLTAQPVKVWERVVGQSNANLTNSSNNLYIYGRGADSSFILSVSSGPGVPASTLRFRGYYWFDAEAKFFIKLPDFNELHVVHVSASELLLFNMASFSEVGPLLYFTHKDDQLITQDFGSFGAAPFMNPNGNLVDRDNFFTLSQHDGNVYLTKWRFQTPMIASSRVGISISSERRAILEATSAPGIPGSLDSSPDLKQWQNVADFLGTFKMEISSEQPQEFFRVR